MLNVEPPPTNLNQLAERLKALAEPKRLLILHLLMEGVYCNLHCLVLVWVKRTVA